MTRSNFGTRKATAWPSVFLDLRQTPATRRGASSSRAPRFTSFAVIDREQDGNAGPKPGDQGAGDHCRDRRLPQMEPKKSIPFRERLGAFPVALTTGGWLNTLPAWSRGLSKKVTIVQDEDIKLLRRIVASGGRKYTAGNIDRSKYDRLVEMGWLMPFKTNISDVEYQATDKGRTAAVANGR